MQAYKKYKDSGINWLGKIPAHWGIEKGKWMFRKMERPVLLRYEVITCFRDGQVTLRKNRREDGFTNSIKEIGYQGVEIGDLVIHQMDAFAGAIGVSDSEGKSTPVYSVCTPRIPSVNNYYYAYFLRNMALSGLILSLAKGIRERSTDFRFNDFANLFYPLPPLHEQEAIASFLDEKCGKIDEAISIKESQIEKLREFRQITIHEAVTKGLDKKVKMKDSGVDWIGEIPEHWEVKKVKHLSQLYGRIGFRGYTTSDLVNEGEGCITISPSNIMGDHMQFNKNSYLSWEKYHESPEIKIFEGDILIVKTGSTVGKVGMIKKLKESATINPQLLVVKAIKINKIFLFEYLHSNTFYDLIKSNSIGSTIPTISETKIGTLPVPIPPLPEQEEIVSYLEDQTSKVDQAIDLKEKQIVQLKEYKQSLINEVVTGKVCVPQLTSMQ